MITREEVRNKIFEHFKKQVDWINSNPNQTQQFQLGGVLSLFNDIQPTWERNKVCSIAREIVQDLILSGYIYPGIADDASRNYPWLTITEFGKEAFSKDDWLPYDPDGYIQAIKNKTPQIDDITLMYIGESVSAYNRRQLLSATITLGVASENLMLTLIEAYINWMSDIGRKTAFQKKVDGRFISIQYKEFKKEFINDIKKLPKELQSDWESYIDTIFNFIRINRNDAGHPTGKDSDAKIVYANLQIFGSYLVIIYQMIEFFTNHISTTE